MAHYYGGGVLSHYGIKGQKWGVRRYQNEDGSLTSAGKARYLNLQGGAKVERSGKSKYVQKLDEMTTSRKGKTSYEQWLDSMTRSSQSSSRSNIVEKKEKKTKDLGHTAQETAVQRAKGKNWVEKFLSYQTELAEIQNNRGNI